jgi:hypothetical protein
LGFIRAGGVSNPPHANVYAQPEQQQLLQIQQQQQQQQQHHQEEDQQIDGGCGLLFLGAGESAARVLGFLRRGLRTVGRRRRACQARV